MQRETIKNEPGGWNLKNKNRKIEEAEKYWILL